MESLTFQNLFKFSFDFNHLSNCLELMRTSLIRTEERISYLEKQRVSTTEVAEGKHEGTYENPLMERRIDKLEDNLIKFQRTVEEKFEKALFNLDDIPQVSEDFTPVISDDEMVNKKKERLSLVSKKKSIELNKSDVFDKRDSDQENDKKQITQIITTHEQFVAEVTKKDLEELKSLLLQQSVIL